VQWPGFSINPAFLLPKYNKKGDDTNGVCNDKKRIGMSVYDCKRMFLQRRDLPSDRGAMQWLQPSDGTVSWMVLRVLPGTGSQVEKWQLQPGHPCRFKYHRKPD